MYIAMVSVKYVCGVKHYEHYEHYERYEHYEHYGHFLSYVVKYTIYN